MAGYNRAHASDRAGQALAAAQTLNVPVAIAAGCRQGRTTWSAALMVANQKRIGLTTTATAWSQVGRAGRTPCVTAGHATAILGEGEAIVPEDRFVGGFGHTDSPIPAPLLSFSRPLRQKLRECPKSTAYLLQLRSRRALPGRTARAFTFWGRGSFVVKYLSLSPE